MLSKVTRSNSHASSKNPHINTASKQQDTKASAIKSIAAKSIMSLTGLFGSREKKPLYRSENPMLRNLARQLEDFGKGRQEIEALIKGVESHKSTAPLAFSYHAKEAQGIRREMEDAHFISETPEALIFGICDGHADKSRISELCAKRLPEFLTKLKSTGGDVRLAIQSLIDQIHQQVLRDGLEGGSTVLFCYVDKKTNIMIVATLGDTEVRLYRGGKCIPLSRVLSWRDKNEAIRAAEALNDPDIAEDWPKVHKDQAKQLRAPDGGLNLSRAVGDQDLPLENPAVKLIIQKAKFTQFALQEGDIVIPACDGVWDIEKKEPGREVELGKDIIFPYKNLSPAALAEKIVHYALYTHASSDNVSVIVVKVTKKN